MTSGQDSRHARDRRSWPSSSPPEPAPASGARATSSTPASAAGPSSTAPIATALAAGIGPVVVVTAGQLATALHPAVVHIVNDDWADGQITSLRAGIDAASGLGASAVVVGLGDQPFVSVDAWRAIAATDAPIAVATYDGRRGHPVRLARETWPLLPEHGDQGARTLIDKRPDLVTAVPCDGSPIDIDTVEDLRQWQNNSSTSSP